MGFLKKKDRDDVPPPPPPPEDAAAPDAESALTDEEDSSYGPVPPPPPPGPELVQAKQEQYDEENAAKAKAAAAAEGGNQDGAADDDYDMRVMPDKHDPPSQDVTMDVTAEDFADAGGGGGGGLYEDDDESVEIPPTSIVQRMLADEKADKDGGGSRLCRLTALVACCLVVLAVVLGAGFGTGAFTQDSGGGGSSTKDSGAGDGNGGGGDGDVGDGNSDRDAPPQNDPEDPVREEDIQVYLASISSVPAAFEVEGSAQKQASDWLIKEDPLMLGTDTASEQFRLAQRYALVSFYYGDNATSWDSSDGWLAAEDECTWFGVTCEARDVNGETLNVVTQIQLSDNSLGSPVNPDFALLGSLKTLE